jgi:hypothetical protein
MRKRMLRSVLVAAFSAVMAFGALGGHSDVKGDTRADSHWPAVVVAGPDDSHWPVSPAADSES